MLHYFIIPNYYIFLTIKKCFHRSNLNFILKFIKIIILYQNNYSNLLVISTLNIYLFLFPILLIALGVALVAKLF